MRFITTLLFFLFFFIALNGQHPKRMWYEGDFVGKVKSYRQTSYVAEDRFGKLIKTGRTSETLGPFDVEKKYNRAGNLLELTRYFGSGMSCIRDVYDYQANKLEIATFKCDSTISDKMIFKLNGKGEIVEYRRYDSMGTIGYIEVYKHSLNGDTIFHHMYDPQKDQELGQKITISKHDDDANIVEQIIYEFGDMFIRGIYRYNDKNKLKKIEKYTFDHGNEVIRNTVKYYDDREDIVGKTIYNVEHESPKVIDKKYTYQYEYDHHGNWIKKIHYEKRVPRYVTERSILYYEKHSDN